MLTPLNKSQQNYGEFDKWTLINAQAKLDFTSSLFHHQTMLAMNSQLLPPPILLLISYLEQFIDCRIYQQSVKIQDPLEKSIKHFNTGYLR